MQPLAWVVLTILLVLGSPAPVAAHGDFRSADPEPDSTVRRAPQEVTIVFTEEPASGTTLKVHDGCVRDLVVDLSRSGSEVTASLEKGQPGNWHVLYRSVSAVDGHTVRGNYSFFVKGKHDCSEKEKSPDTETAAADGGDEPRLEPEDGGGGFPWVPFGLGSVVVIGLAFVLRRAAR